MHVAAENAGGAADVGPATGAHEGTQNSTETAARVEEPKDTAGTEAAADVAPSKPCKSIDEPCLASSANSVDAKKQEHTVHEATKSKPAARKRASSQSREENPDTGSTAGQKGEAPAPLAPDISPCEPPFPAVWGAFSSQAWSSIYTTVKYCECRGNYGVA